MACNIWFKMLFRSASSLLDDSLGTFWGLIKRLIQDFLILRSRDFKACALITSSTHSVLYNKAYINKKELLLFLFGYPLSIVYRSYLHRLFLRFDVHKCYNLFVYVAFVLVIYEILVVQITKSIMSCCGLDFMRRLGCTISFWLKRHRLVGGWMRRLHYDRNPNTCATAEYCGQHIY